MNGEAPTGTSGGFDAAGHAWAGRGRRLMAVSRRRVAVPNTPAYIGWDSATTETQCPDLSSLARHPDQRLTQRVSHFSFRPDPSLSSVGR